ncbi:MAG: hypothetical protein PWQ57_2152 [Desulfovibrionales bacterium]|jgi:hypothetical protein|nr:hypothetical protein [Desulfovibrionales bacterium]
MLLDLELLNKLEEYIASGDLAFEFEHGDEDKRYLILDFLEKLMDLAELADETATELIFKKGQLEALAGIIPQK